MGAGEARRADPTSEARSGGVRGGVPPAVRTFFEIKLKKRTFYKQSTLNWVAARHADLLLIYVDLLIGTGLINPLHKQIIELGIQMPAFGSANRVAR